LLAVASTALADIRETGHVGNIHNEQ